MLKLLKQYLILPDGVNVSTLVEFQVILVTVSYPQSIKWHANKYSNKYHNHTNNTYKFQYVHSILEMTPKMVTTMVTITLYNTVHWHGI